MASPISHFQSFGTGRPVASMQYSYNRDTLQMNKKCGRTVTTVSITSDELHSLENMQFNDFIGPTYIFADATARVKSCDDEEDAYSYQTPLSHLRRQRMTSCTETLAESREAFFEELDFYPMPAGAGFTEFGARCSAYADAFAIYGCSANAVNGYFRPPGARSLRRWFRQYQATCIARA